jgi:hypothetical protein
MMLVGTEMFVKEFNHSCCVRRKCPVVVLVFLVFMAVQKYKRLAAL